MASAHGVNQNWLILTNGMNNMSFLRAILNTENWMNPRLIPKRIGFKFRARLKDGRQVDCITYRGDFAIGVLIRSDECPGLQFEDIDAWLEV